MDDIFSQQLWAAAGLRSKLLHISRSYFFPDSECADVEDDPSTSYDQAEDGPRSHKRSRGGRQAAAAQHHRPVTNSRNDMPGGAQRLPAGHSSRRVRLPMNTFQQASYPVAGSSAWMDDGYEYSFDAQDEAGLAANSICTDFLSSTPRKHRSGAPRRRRADICRLLAAIDVMQLLEPVPDKPDSAGHTQEVPCSTQCQLLPVVELAPTACAETALAQQPELHHEGASSPKKVVKWQHDEHDCHHHRHQHINGGHKKPMSAAYSASSSQGGCFASELSSPERISHWTPESSDDLG